MKKHSLDREKTVLVITVLSLQLEVWLKHSRDLGHLTGKFKLLSTNLLTHLTAFIKFFFTGFESEREQVYDHSVMVSEVIEKLVQMDEDDIRRVSGLINKIQKDKEQNLKAA